VVTSYFGLISESRPVRFPVHIGQIPMGNAIVVSDSSGNLPAGLNLPSVSSPTVAMRTNPSDPYSKILVVAGGDSDQVLRAAQAVALHTDLLQGAQSTIDSLRLPDKQQPDGAPRWARTDQTIALWDYATADQLQGDGSAPCCCRAPLALSMSAPRMFDPGLVIPVICLCFSSNGCRRWTRRSLA
jgi:cellulose synthase (UDP-forming)